MNYYSVQARDKNSWNNIAKHMCKNWSGKYTQTLLDHARQSVTDALITASKRAMQK